MGRSTSPAPGGIPRKILLIDSPYVSGGTEKAAFLVLGMRLFLMECKQM